MGRFIAVAAVAIVVGVFLGWRGNRQTFDGVQERFERRPLEFPAKEGSPFEPKIITMEHPSAKASGENGNSEASEPDNPAMKSEIGSGFPVNVPAGNSIAPFSPEKAPKAEIINGTLHDFGTMQRRSKKSHTFIIRNIGQSELDLKVEGSTCKCTIGTLSKEQLKPGEETGITLEWKTETSGTEFGQSAEIRTNDPRQPMIKLTVKGIVVDQLLVEPVVIDMGDFATNQNQVRTLKLYSFADKPVELKNITWSDKKSADFVKFSHQAREVSEEKDGTFSEAKQVYDVTVELLEGFPQGKLNGVIRFETDIEKEALLECNVRGNGVGDVTLLGGKNFDLENNILELGTVKKSEGKETKIFVSVKGPNREKIELSVATEIPEEAVQVKIGEGTPRGESILYPLMITIPKDGPLSNYPGTAVENFGKIVLKYKSESEYELPIYLRLVVSEE
jgi:hypothetical protein